MASLRASDRERDAAVARLREHLASGRLTLDEFCDRMGRACTATHVDELAALEDDLPALAPSGGHRRSARFTAALLAHVVRRGRLRLPRRAVVLAAGSDVDLDLRDAEVVAGRATVTAVVGFANLDVYVPEGVAVDVGGLVVLGHRREWGPDRPLPGAPVLTVRVYGVLGTIDVWRVPHGATGSYRELMSAAKERPAALPEAGDAPGLGEGPGAPAGD